MLEGSGLAWQDEQVHEVRPGDCVIQRANELEHTFVAGLEGLDYLVELERLTAMAAPELVALFGVGHDSAGALLVAAGDNPGRLHREAAFSMLCGASPIPASSGKTVRHRLM